MTNKVLFLDRDGPINIVGPNGYVHTPKHFHFTDGIFSLCREATQKKYRIFVITNQTGIGLGDYTEQDAEKVHDYMLGEFKKQGVKITDIFYTRYPTSANRKPSPGMFLLAKEKYELTDMDMHHAIAIGDRQKDAEAALRAGVRNLIYFQNEQILDKNWRVTYRPAIEMQREIQALRQEFQTLAIFSALANAKSQRARLVRKHAPNLMIINNYKQLEGHL